MVIGVTGRASRCHIPRDSGCWLEHLRHGSRALCRDRGGCIFWDAVFKIQLSLGLRS